MKGDALRWFVLLVIIAASGSGLYYRYQDTRPCTHPVSYAIGAIDARFGVDTTALVSDAETAAAIWNKAARKTVLVYDPKAALKINLVYDAREANAKLGSQIAQRQVADDATRAAIDSAQAELVTEQAAYTQAVSAVNARGGATPSEAAALNAQRVSLNTHADSINSRVASYNADVAALNAVVRQYNQIAGHTFEEGDFVRDSAGVRINVFEFVGATQLTRVLAHEFGHALGLDHNADPKSIMFAKNESGNLVPTASDLSALRTACGA